MPLSDAGEVGEDLLERVHQHEDRPQAVDHRRDGREQVDHVDDRPRDARRCDLGDEQRDADADRHREEQREESDEEGAVDQRAGAELALRRRPSCWRRSRGPPPRTTATPSAWSRTAMSPRITSTIRPPSRATQPEQVVGDDARRAPAGTEPLRRGFRLRRRFGGRSDHGHGVSSFSVVSSGRGAVRTTAPRLAGGGWCGSSARRGRDGDLLDLRLGLLEQTLRAAARSRPTERSSGPRRRCSSRNALIALPFAVSVCVWYTSSHVGAVIGYAFAPLALIGS